MKAAALLCAALAALVSAKPAPTPTQELEKRATTYCGQWDSVQTGSYIVYNNLWGMSSGTGSQCTTVNGLSGSTLSWSTSWSWSGGSSSVKSYANAVLQASAAKVSAISQIPTTWKWTYTGSNIVANVAYDLFTNSDCGSTAQYEIMIWLAALGGAGPISSTGSTIATPSIGGVTWNLYKGVNGQMTVFSFVASSSQASFSGDLKNFLSYLVSSQGFPSSQCLYSIGAGTEPFTGSSAVLTVSSYSISVSTSGSSGSSTTTSSGSSTTSSSSGTCVALYGQCGGSGYSGSTTCCSGTCTYSNAWYSQCL